MSSNEESSGGDSPAGEEDCEWLGGSMIEEVSKDGLDQDSN